MFPQGSSRSSFRVRSATVVAVAALALSLSASRAATAQGRVELEVHGGFNVPTFDIADLAKAGPSFGAALAFKLSPKVWLIGEADFGFHKGAELSAGVDGPDVDVFHFMGKVGYTVYTSPSGKRSLLLNTGAGVLSFDVDGPATAKRYFAINAGAKLTYVMSRNLDFVLSPQGDIAFSEKSVLGGSTAWVWPISAGLRVRF
jgi:hypothetical protein